MFNQFDQIFVMSIYPINDYIAMSSRQMLLGYFSRLSPQEIRKLSNFDKDQLLFMLQKHILQTTSAHNLHQLHNKKTKNQRQISYKCFIRRNMPFIIRKCKNQLRREAIISNKSFHSEEAKLKFKQTLRSALRRKMQDFHKHSQQVVNQENRQQLTCTICLQIFVHPVLTNCGHTFCLQCLDESLLFSSNCPNCRENIKGSELIKCTILSNFIRNSNFINTPKQGYPTYKQRFSLFEEWKKKRYINCNEPLKIGTPLDVRDTENIWCQGVIINFEYNGEQKDTPVSILVHFNRWSNIYNEMIEITSHRLAPFRFFTVRTDIPRYSLSLQDENMRGLVISGTNDQMPRQDLIVQAVSSSSESESDDDEDDDDSPVLPAQPIGNNQANLIANPVSQNRSRVDQILSNWNIMFRMPMQADIARNAEENDESNQPEIQGQQQLNEQS